MIPKLWLGLFGVLLVPAAYELLVYSFSAYFGAHCPSLGICAPLASLCHHRHLWVPAILSSGLRSGCPPQPWLQGYFVPSHIRAMANFLVKESKKILKMQARPSLCQCCKQLRVGCPGWRGQVDFSRRCPCCLRRPSGNRGDPRVCTVIRSAGTTVSQAWLWA